MNRRGFLGTLALSAGAFALDPERLLWRPGEKAIFIPPVPKVWYETIKINAPISVDLEFNDADFLMTIDEFRILYIEPAISHYMESDPEIVRGFFPNAGF